MHADTLSSKSLQVFQGHLSVIHVHLSVFMAVQSCMYSIHPDNIVICFLDPGFLIKYFNLILV